MTKQAQNKDELCAEEWLKRQEYSDVRRLDCDPPDFLVGGRYAVEVTRLNQRIRVGNRIRTIGEEESRLPLKKSIEQAVRKLGVPGNKGKSWIIDCEYVLSKPLPNLRTIESQIQNALKPLTMPYDDKVVSDIHSRFPDPHKHADEIASSRFPHIYLPCGICLALHEVPYSFRGFFVQNVSDGYGLNVARELATGIEYKIRRKSETIRKQHKIKKYAHWWLILVDYVYHVPMQQLPQDQLTFVREQNFDFWSRIVVIGSRSPVWHYDLIEDGAGYGHDDQGEFKSVENEKDGPS